MSSPISKNYTKKLLRLAIVCAFSLSLFYFWEKINTQAEPKTKTQHSSITFNVPQGWIIYQEAKNYDFDLGLFKNHSKKETLLCRINVITANLNRTPTFEEFMGTTLGNKLFQEVHQEIDYKGTKAWQATYSFPSAGIVDPVENERILFKYQSIYTDITLSYSQDLENQQKNECSNTFKNFINQIVLLD